MAQKATATSRPAAQQTYVRFAIAERIEHSVLIASFTTLAVTGLIQKAAGSPNLAVTAPWLMNFSVGLIKALGGIETTRTIHHAAAILFLAQAVYHLIVVLYKLFVQHREPSMLPGISDLTDAIGVIKYNLGLAKSRPALPRYGFEEKMEYWAMIWGTVLMGLTGFMLWNPIMFTRFLPGQLIPAAKVAHGAEAILAVLAILVWHLYGVHLKFFNKSMWTGRLTEHQMAEEHGLELARIKSGQLGSKPSPVVVQRRTRAFVPMAAVIAIVLLGGMGWLATAEKTAIATVPTPASQEQAYVPLPTATQAPLPTATPAPTAKPGETAQPAAPAASGPAAIPHDIAGREQCDSCHGTNGVKPYPADHAGRSNSTCTGCHQPASASAGATPAAGGSSSAGAAAGATPSPDTCLGCHGPMDKLIAANASAEADDGTKVNPHTYIPHDSKDVPECTQCHTPHKANPTAADIKALPAPSIDYCYTCHHQRNFTPCTQCHAENP